MLSVQLAAMQLNLAHAYVSAGMLVYAPSTTVANAAGFGTLGSLVAAADAALAADGFTPSGDSNRMPQESLKNALDQANQGRSYAQASRCAFTFA